MHWAVPVGVIGVMTLLSGWLIWQDLNREERSVPALSVVQAAPAGERLTLDLPGAAAVYVQDETGEFYTYTVSAPARINARFAERWIARPLPGYGSAAADVRAAGTGPSTDTFDVARSGDYECWMDWSNARAGDRVAGRITARADGQWAETSLGDIRASGDGAGRSAPRGVTFSPAGEAIVSVQPVPDGLEWRVACRRAK